MLNLDLDVLRSFVTGLELGSFARAADRLGRSTSAVSAQLKKLEEQVGTPVLRKSGRGLALTPAGEIVHSYARRLLELNDAAVMAVRGAQLSGTVRIGFLEDFGDGVLTEVLGTFARAHPSVSVDARIARNRNLEDAIGLGQLDLALAWHDGQPAPRMELLGRIPMRWIGHRAVMDESLAERRPLPLVVFEAPCRMRNCAIEELDRAGIPWRIAFTSTSLNGIWSAVRAGLGVTVRTDAGKPAALATLGELPALPEIGISLHRASDAPDAVLEHLAGVIRERMQAFF